MRAIGLLHFRAKGVQLVDMTYDKSTVRGLLFDKDGTLLDFQETWGVWAAKAMPILAEGDAKLAQILADELGIDLAKGKIDAGSVAVAGTPADIAQAIVGFLPNHSERSLSDLLLALCEDVKAAPLLDLPPLFDQFKDAGLALGIGTNDGDGVARKQAIGLGIDGHLDFIAGFDSGYGGKPGPGMCLAFADHVGLKPHQVAMIGDSTHDLLAGRAAGMICVGVTSGLVGHEVLAPHADVVLADIGEIPAWLGLANSHR